MMSLTVEEEQKAYGADANPADRAVAAAFEGYEQPYDTERSRAQLLDKLKAKHGVGSDR
jgi:RHH-type rel operon transcriptional repressor/antitoxin RelB